MSKSTRIKEKCKSRVLCRYSYQDSHLWFWNENSLRPTVCNIMTISRKGTLRGGDWQERYIRTGTSSNRQVVSCKSFLSSYFNHTLLHFISVQRISIPNFASIRQPPNDWWICALCLYLLVTLEIFEQTTNNTLPHVTQFVNTVITGEQLVCITGCLIKISNCIGGISESGGGTETDVKKVTEPTIWRWLHSCACAKFRTLQNWVST